MTVGEIFSLGGGRGHHDHDGYHGHYKSHYGGGYKRHYGGGYRGYYGGGYRYGRYHRGGLLGIRISL